MIFLLNAPPYAGKDTASNFITDHYGSISNMLRFAEPLKAATPKIYGITEARFKELDQMPFKDLPCEEFLGLSPRQVQINLSEEYLKVIHGKEVFGKILANKIGELFHLDSNRIISVPDSGFDYEAEVLVRQFGAENMTLIRIHKDGCNYGMDSRSYINLDHAGVVSFDVTNVHGNLELFKGRILEITENRLA